MIVTESPQLRLRHRLELVVIRVPDIQQRQEIRIRMNKAPVRRIRLLLFFERPLARILNRRPAAITSTSRSAFSARAWRIIRPTVGSTGSRASSRPTGVSWRK